MTPLSTCHQTDMSCFQGLFFCPDAFSLLLHNFCIYHISPPGHEVGLVNPWIIYFCSAPSTFSAILAVSYLVLLPRVFAVRSCCSWPWWTVVDCWWFSRSDCWNPRLFWVISSISNIYVPPLFSLNKLYGCILSEPIESISMLDHLFANIHRSRANSHTISRLGAVMCLGVTAGAYILTLFAVSCSPRRLYLCISPLVLIRKITYCFTAAKILAACYGPYSCFPCMQSTILDGVVM